MKFLSVSKDGGPESRVWAYWLIEWKSVFSVVLLHFKDGTRDAYHSHAFNAVSWVLKGELFEETMQGEVAQYTPSFRPIFTPRERIHKVTSHGDTWALSFRGRWISMWLEYVGGKPQILTHGRRVLRGTQL